MPVGRSGRIVVELDPETKRRLHARLRSEGRDFKGWLLERVQEYLGAPRQNEGAPRESEGAAQTSVGVPEGGEGPLGALSEPEARVLGAFSSHARGQLHVEDLVQATGLRIGEVYEALLQLELQGRVVQDFGLYRRVRPS